MTRTPTPSSVNPKQELPPGEPGSRVYWKKRAEWLEMRLNQLTFITLKIPQGSYADMERHIQLDERARIITILLESCPPNSAVTLQSLSSLLKD